MSGCRRTPKNTQCAGDFSSPAKVYPPFECCLPVGRALHWDGQGLTLTDGPQPNDGIYGQVVVEGGCVTALRPAEVPVHVPPPCVAAPEPCYTENGAHIQITGTGTLQDPLKVTGQVVPNDTKLINDSPDLLSLDGTGSLNDPYRLAHRKPPAPLPITMGGFTVDGGGHIQNYTPPANTEGVKKIQPQPPTGVIEVTESSQYPGVVLISLTERFTSQRQFHAGDEVITLNQYGQVTAIEEAPAPLSLADRFAQSFSGSRTEMLHSFETRLTGRFRISYRGDVGAVSGAGMLEAPAGFSFNLDGQTQAAWLFVTGGRALGFEMLTANAYTAGPHLLTVTLPAAVTSPGLLDVVLCQ